MTLETDLFGVFFSGALTTAVLALLPLLALRRLLQWAGLYRFVWHRNLADLALFAILWAATAVTLSAFSPVAGRAW